ncbi:MAG: hypothetical protein ACTHOJ_15650 [Sphingomonas oligoaromativorans]
MTGLATRLVIPAPLQAAWAIAKPLLPYLGCALAALLLVLHFEGVGERRQKDRDTAAIAAINQQRDSWIGAFRQSNANFRAAIGIANAESASILALKKDGDERARQAKAQLAEAIKQNAALTEQSEVLIQSAGRHYSASEPCASSGAYMTAKYM